MDTQTFHNNQEPALNEDAVNHFLQDQNVTDTYDSTKTYAVGDYCINENKLYRCTTAITTAEDFTTEHWTATTMMAEINSKIANLQQLLYKIMQLNSNGTINTSKAYYIDPSTGVMKSLSNDGKTFTDVFTR